MTGMTPLDDFDDVVEVMEFWYRDPRNPYGWYDRWVAIPSLGIRYGVCFPAIIDRVQEVAQ